MAELPGHLWNTGRWSAFFFHQPLWTLHTILSFSNHNHIVYAFVSDQPATKYGFFTPHTITTLTVNQPYM